MTEELQIAAVPAWSGRRVLIVGINYAPEVTGIAPYTTALAEHLAGAGAEVTVLAGVPHYPGWHVEHIDRRWTRTEVLNGVTVRRLRHHVPKRMSTLSRGAYELTFWMHARLQRLDAAPDLVVGVTPALGGALAAAHFAKKFRVPLVLHVQDLMGAAASQSGITGGGKVAGLVGREEARVLRQADAVAIVSAAMEPALLAAGVHPERITHVPNWTHIEAPTVDRETTRTSLGWLPEQKIVLHTGNMGLKQDLGNVIEAARLSQGHPHLRWVLMGNGSQRGDLMARAGGLTNVDFIEPCAERDYANVLAAADVLLVNERATMADASLPSKLTSYAVTEIPIVAAVTVAGATATLLRSIGAGDCIVEPGQPELLVKAVLGGGLRIPPTAAGVEQLEAALLGELA